LKHARDSVQQIHNYRTGSFLEHAGLAARPPPVRLAEGFAFDEDANALADDYRQVEDHDDPA